MNIRDYFVRAVQKKHGNFPRVLEEDMQFIVAYLEPVQALLGSHFHDICSCIFEIFQSQIDVYTEDNTYDQRLCALLDEKFPELKSGQTPSQECMEQFTNDPLYKKYILMLHYTMLMSSLRIQPDDQRVALKISNLITQIVATRSVHGHEDLLSEISTLSFDGFSQSFMIHSILPTLMRTLEHKDAEKTYRSMMEKYPNSNDDFEAFKKKSIQFVKDYDVEHKAYAMPIIEQAYNTYQKTLNHIASVQETASINEKMFVQEGAFDHLKIEDETGVTDMNFMQDVIEESKIKPVLVDFWADWCPPCKAMMPVIDELKLELASWLTVCKAEFEQNQQICSSMQIKSLPTLVLFYDGKEISRVSAGLPKEKIIKFIHESMQSLSTQA